MQAFSLRCSEHGSPRPNIAGIGSGAAAATEKTKNKKTDIYEIAEKLQIKSWKGFFAMTHVDTENPVFYVCVVALIALFFSLVLTILLCFLNRLVGFVGFLFSMLLAFVFLLTSTWTLVEDFDD